MIEKVSHIGIAVKSLENAIAYYEKSLGLKCSRTEEVVSEKVRVAFFDVGDTRIELLEPMSEESPIAKFLTDRGEGIHHLAFQTDDLSAQMQQAKESGIRLINETPKDGAHGMKIAFLHPKSTLGVLTELCAPAKH